MDRPKVASGEFLREMSVVDVTNVSNCYSDYPPIISVEQRRKYKTEFDKDYAEYRKLHLIMDKARRRFANLQQELSNVNPSERKYKVINGFDMRVKWRALDAKVFLLGFICFL
jgi:Occludin homology domain